MVRYSQILRGLIVSFLLFLSSQAQAQFQDTVLVDYTTYSCLICSDSDYACYSTDSLNFVDSTTASLRLTELKFLFLHTPCSSSPTTLLLNGDTMGTWNNSYSCSCNSCTMDSIVITGAKLASYMQNDTNHFLYTGSASLCISRYMIIRTWGASSDYDMSAYQLVNPLFQCPGSQDIEINIANYGRKQVDSVEIHWIYNGSTQSTVKDTGTIDTIGGSGSFIKKVTLGTKTLVKNQVDTLVAWTENPNGVTDTVRGNDTIQVYIRPAYKDTLTIGGSSPDFAKVQDAFDALMLYGVCGPVVLNIRTGSYNEQLTLGYVPGTDTTNTITVQSVTGDSTDVKIYYTSTSTDNYTLQLDHTSFVRFKNLTVEATSSSYFRVVWLNEGNEDIAFINCRITGPSISSTSTTSALFFSNPTSQPSNNIQIRHCRFEKGSYGVYFVNPYNAYGAGYFIENCQFTEQYHKNIECRYTRDVFINFNSISQNASSSGYGHNINIDYGAGQLHIKCNDITSLNGGIGIEIDSKTGDTSNVTQIVNNFVTVTHSSSGSCIPLRLYYSNFILVAHNSFYAECSYSSNVAVSTHYGSMLRFTGNSIFNKNTGRAWFNEYSSSANVIHSNHNNIYTLGSSIGFWNKTASNLSDWQTISGQDSNSVSADPVHTSSTNLHASAVELNGAADPTTGIMEDFDKEPRDSLRPDIGADEFKLPPNDAALVELKKFRSDTSCINVVLRNLGDDTLKSVTIAWLFDGSTQTPYSWTGALVSGDTALVCVGTKVFKRDSAYNIKLWTSSPNGVTDTINHNDTLSQRVFPALSGIYTIGGTSPDYPTFSAAIAALDSAGVLDSAIFKVRDGTYNERLHLTEIECVDRKNQVIFESESSDSTKVVLESSSASYSSNYIIWLDGADGITFRKMTIANNTLYYKRVVYISNGAHYNQFNNNIIQNNDSLSSSTSYALVYNESTSDHDFCLINNVLNRGSYGYYGRGVYSDPDRNTIIRGNTFMNQGYEGINGIYLSDFRLTSNSFTSMSNNYWSSVDFDECHGQNRIERNNIVGPNLNERYGLYLNDFDYGDTTWILNNFVSVGGTNTGCYPLHVEDFSRAMIYNNSLNLYNNDTNTSGALFLEGGSFNCFNNHLICENGGYGMYRNYGTVISDYNNFVTPSAKFSYWSGTTYSDLNAHVTGTSQDSNSISADPQYYSSTNLHVRNPAIDMTGMAVSFVTTDIDGETRDTVPDIGADEISPAKYDIGVSVFINPGAVFAADTNQIKVAIFNYGTDTVFSGTVKMRINSDTLADVGFTDTLLSGDTLQINLGSYVFLSDSTYSYQAWTVDPNGTTDQKMSNDTLKVNNKVPSMRGIYTIGGTSPDFPNFTAAIEKMILRGIVDSVKFKVRNGTYTEQLFIPPIAGASGKNSIIFEGESLDSSLVTLTYAATKYDTNYTVYLFGADGVTFRHISIVATGTSYGRVLVFDNGSDDLCVEHCQLLGVDINTSSSNYLVIYSNGDADHSFVLKNSFVKDGSSAIYLSGPSTYSMRESGSQIIGNRIIDFYGYGIYSEYQRGFEIMKNTIRTDASSSSFAMIYLYYTVDTSTVSKNNIIIDKSRPGIMSYYPGNASGDSCVYSNNTISIAAITSSYFGMNLYYPRGTFVAHNSINILGSSNGSYCLGMTGGGSNNVVANNICENQAGGYTLYFDGSSTVTTSNFNNVRTTGSQFGYFNSTNFANLSKWQTTTGYDSNSTQVNPEFVADNDLHLGGVDLDGTVRRVAYVLDDIDGQSRDSITDVGADEIRLKGLDAGIARILTPNQPFKSDTQYVQVVLKNYGSSPLTSVDIHWIFNGDTGTVYQWADTLASKDTAWISIEKKFFDLDSTYSLKAWTAKPNNGVDSLASNDTVETKDQYPALSGHYTIGGASPNFSDFTAAVEAMKKGGIVDSVIFTVRNGTYNEQITIPRILGATAKNSIIFQSAGTTNTANVILSFTGSSFSNNYVVKLDSALGVTFKRITLTNPGTSYATIVSMLNNADYNEFRSCVFKGNSSSSSTSSYRYLVNSTVSNGHNNDYNCFISNEFIEGSIGMYAYGYNSGVYDKNWVFKFNTFKNQYYMAINNTYSDSVTFHGNTAEHAGTYRTSSNYGFYFQYVNGGFSFTSNITKGLYYRSAYFYQCDGSSSHRSLIANNMLHSSHSGSYVLSIENCDYVDIYYNNLHSSATGGTNRALYTYFGSNQNLANNIMVEAGAGYAWYQYGSTSIFSQIDHNDYYGAGSNLAYINYSNRSNFAALKSSTGKDTNSLNVDPGFVASDDLHVREITLNEAGTVVAVVSVDIDLDTRDSLKPDIGADEFEPPAPEDAGILAYYGPQTPFTHGSKNVEVVLKNFGSDTLTTTTIHWTANGTNQSNYSWTGSLLPGKVDTVSLGSFTFNRVTEYSFVFWTTVPNGVTDTINYNDTASVMGIYAALDTVYTIGSSGADFPDFTTAANVLQKAGIADTVTFKVQSGTYNEQISIGSFNGESKSRPVTFESLTGDSTDVILTHKSSFGSNYLIQLTGADYVTFKYMTFKPTDYYYGHGIDISGESKGIQILNNRFLMYTNPYYYNSIGVLSSTDNDDSCRIENNYFTEGNQAIELYGLGSSNAEKGIVIKNNIIENTSRTAIYTQNQENLTIVGNTITLKNNSASKSGIQAYNVKNGMDISCNDINSIGIYDYGIQVNYTGTSSSVGFISNNFISLKNNANSRYGIYTSTCAYLTMAFNSINIYGGSNTSTYALRTYYGNDIKAFNNILCNRNGGYALYIQGTGVTESDYNDLFTTGTNLAYFSGNHSSLSALQTATGDEANSMSTDPLFTANDNLHVYISNLDSAGTPITGITQDIDKDTRNTTHPDIGADEFNSLLRNVGVSAFVKPMDGCDLDSQVIGVKIFNYGSQPQSNFAMYYSIDGGTAVKDSFTDTVAPGGTINFDFSTKHYFGTHKVYQLKSWTKLLTDQDVLNDSNTTSITNYATPNAVSNMFPLDTTKNLEYPITLSWAPANGATEYDVYIWDDTASTRPTTPFKADLTQISTQISSGLTYGRTFKWQVVAKNNSCGTDGPIQRFTMRYLPDLIVESVSAPTTAFSGNTISISWKVKNIGGGPTGSRGWYDLVYLSSDTILDNSDLFIGGVRNATALNVSSNYSQSLSVTLANGFTGNYHAIIKCNGYSNLDETDENNNIGFDTSAMSVSLTPPPDLIVTSIISPKVAFSGSSINVQYTVKNNGTGATRNGFWYDKIYWSDDTTFGVGATFMKSILRSSNLAKDSSYTVGASIQVPNFIQGKHYVYVQTDANNNEYEHTSESNNVSRGDTIGVILSPPPDLVVRNVDMKDTVSSCEDLFVRFNTINQGGGHATRSFYDQVYYSSSSVFSTSTATSLRSKYISKLDAGDTAFNSIGFQIPTNIAGKYYLFVVTDINNSINEHTNEDNNVSSVDSFFVQTPDLIVSSVKTSKRDTTGDTTMVYYSVVNIGKGQAAAKWTEDRIYISKLDTFNVDSSTQLKLTNFNNVIPSGDTIDRSAVITIPDGFDGQRYFYVYTDFSNRIFEDGQEGNNTGRSDTVNIILAPYPDLVAQIVEVPDTAHAGNTATIKFSVTNNGDTTAKANWTDRVYLSKDSIFNVASDVLLSTVMHTSKLLKDSSYDVTTTVTIPSSVSAGDYYYFVVTDGNNNVYEHNKEANNTTKSAVKYVDGYPPVDLCVTSFTASDTFYSGKTTSVSWTVKNVGQARTVANLWSDCIYISSDSFLGSSDTRIHTESISETVNKDSSYTVTVSITVPNGLSGGYYVLVRADKNDANNDADTSNNTGGKRTGAMLTKTTILLTPPPDLQVSFQSVPTTGTAGQQIHVVWKVSNKGTGSTLNGYWSDYIYLSTDYTVDGGDRRIGSKVHPGNLKPDSMYTDSLDVFIPSNFSGNYILIVQTDADKREYEHDKENNNTAATILSVSQAPPADLVVSTVTTIDSIISGEQTTVNWTIQNIGNNPATGYLRDNVYLSKDTKVDATDKLLGTKNYHITLVKNATASSSMLVTISGVSLGDYYVLAQTDVLDNINEANDTNNTGVSASMNVNIPQLVLGVPKSDTLFDLKDRIYRIYIHDSLRGESLLVTLKGDTVNGKNEMYLRKGQVPSRSEFDFGYSNPFESNQEIVVPALDSGTYYLMVHGENDAGSYQNIDLLASILEFEIRKITPAKGGNTGHVTVKIEGSKFTNKTKFTLSNNDGSIAALMPGEDEDRARSSYTNQNADTFLVVDPTLAFVTFNLTGETLGTYDIIGQNGGDSSEIFTTTMKDAFTVEKGLPPDIQLNVTRPANARTNRVVSFAVNYSNNGNTDVVDGKLEIISNGTSPIAFSVDGLSDNKTKLTISLEELGGIDGRLRPGGNGTVRIYTKATNTLGFSIVLPE